MTVYRSDIDGLRAIAVIAVVLFHIGIRSLAGGFIGVDVFFVISGFLITSMIKTRAEAGTFGFRDFYCNRIRRLLPALIAAVAATLLAALAVLTPDDMMAFARTAIAALFSASNIVFFMEAGYWDTVSETKPLLHTWSLGVEEQFYIFWPVLVVALVRLQRRIPFGVSMALITAFGIAFTCWFASVDPSAAFYLLPFRVFQFSAGALATTLANAESVRSRLRQGRQKDVVFVTGLIAIAASILAFGSEDSLPGWFALPPTIGTVLILISGSSNGQGPIGRAVLANPVAAWTGRVSYAMYLVHWPIVALYRYKFGLTLNGMEQIGLGAVTLLSAGLLHYAVERRFYRRSSDRPASRSVLSDGRFALCSLAASVFVASFALHAWLGDGWSWRYPRLELTPTQIRAGQDARNGPYLAGCRVDQLGDRSRCSMDRPHQVLILGNSHEPDGYNMMTSALGARDDINVISFGQLNKCKLKRANGRWMSSVAECDSRLATLQSRAFIEAVDVVVYAANKPFSENKQPLLDLLQDLKTLNPRIRVVTLGGYINTDTPCARLINEHGTSSACRSADHVTYFAGRPEAEPLYAELMSITDLFIDRVELLCEGRKLRTCRTETPSGTPAFYDRHHISLEFSQFTGAELVRQRPDILDALFIADPPAGDHGSRPSAELPVPQRN